MLVVFGSGGEDLLWYEERGVWGACHGGGSGMVSNVAMERRCNGVQAMSKPCFSTRFVSQVASASDNGNACCLEKVYCSAQLFCCCCRSLLCRQRSDRQTMSQRTYNGGTSNPLVRHLAGRGVRKQERKGESQRGR